MNNKVQNAEGILILIGGALALYAIYRVYSVSGNAVKAVGDTVNSITTGVSDFGKAAVVRVKDTGNATLNVVQEAYAQIGTWLTGTKMYSPTALDGSMSKADAIALADQLSAPTPAEIAGSAWTGSVGYDPQTRIGDFAPGGVLPDYQFSWDTTTWDPNAAAAGAP